MTALDLEGLKRLLAEATEGPWEVAKGCDQYICNDGKWIMSTMGIREEQGAANAALIVSLRNNAEALIGEVERLRERLSAAGSDYRASLPVEQGEVVQADRLLFIELFAIPERRQTEVLAGCCDERSEMLAIARHRLAARLTQPRASQPVGEVTVIQADREAAAAFLFEPYTNPHRLMRGMGADDHPLVQAFARHRLAALSPTPARGGEDLRDQAIKQAQFLCDRLDELDWCESLEATANDFSGHVDPALSRLKGTLAALLSKGETHAE
jgi:hypothetical protein